MNRDIFNRTEAQARAIFAVNHPEAEVKLIEGIWVGRWLSKATIRRQHDDIKPYAAFAAINRKGEVVSNGTRFDTIRLAKGVDESVVELEQRLAEAKRAHKRTHDRWSQIESIENQLHRLQSL